MHSTQCMASAQIHPSTMLATKPERPTYHTLRRALCWTSPRPPCNVPCMCTLCANICAHACVSVFTRLKHTVCSRPVSGRYQQQTRLPWTLCLYHGLIHALHQKHSCGRPPSTDFSSPADQAQAQAEGCGGGWGGTAGPCASWHPHRHVPEAAPNYCGHLGPLSTCLPLPV